jgi:dTDP-4-dehydrorhamnose 3,5-epimerase
VSFKKLPTGLEGIGLIEPEVHRDQRGFLVETFREADFAELGLDARFVQDNYSRSRGGIVRGIHMQGGQAKLVRCTHGRIWDVAVDLRPESPTYRRWEGHELDDRSHRQLFIPPGFGHGFCVLSDEADVAYRLSTYYDPALEVGIAWNDPDLAIEWPLADPIVSERDRNAPSLAEIAAALPG